MDYGLALILDSIIKMSEPKINNLTQSITPTPQPAKPGPTGNEPQQFTIPGSPYEGLGDVICTSSLTPEGERHYECEEQPVEE